MSRKQIQMLILKFESPS